MKPLLKNSQISPPLTKGKRKFQFSLATLLMTSLAVGVFLAAFSYSDELAIGVLLAVLLANGLGAVIALVVTFAMKFPRDGSFRAPPLSDEEPEF